MSVELFPYIPLATEAWPLCLKMFEGLVGGQKFVGGIAPLQYRKKGYITYRGTHLDHRDRSGRLREVPPNTSLKFVSIFDTAVSIFVTCMSNRKRSSAISQFAHMRSVVGRRPILFRVLYYARHRLRWIAPPPASAWTSNPHGPHRLHWWRMPRVGS